MSRFFRWNMLVTSFIPLWVSVLFLLAWDVLPFSYSSFACLFKAKGSVLILAAIIMSIAVVSIIAVIRFIVLKRKPNESSGTGKIIAARKSSTLVTDFLLTYIMPLIAFDFTSIRDIVLFFVYFALIAFLNIRNGNVYTNILFEFMGYRVYVCDIERNVAGRMHEYKDCTVISRKSLTGRIEQDFTFYDFDNDIYIDLS